MMAKLLASSLVKLPEITPAPPLIVSLTTGALIKVPSKTIAILLPTFFSVRSPKISAPALFKENDTTGELLSYCIDAS